MVNPIIKIPQRLHKTSNNRINPTIQEPNAKNKLPNKQNPQINNIIRPSRQITKPKTIPLFTKTQILITLTILISIVNKE